MTLSFVIPFHPNRFDNLLQTLRFLIEDHSEVVKESELVAVCQSSIEFFYEKEKQEFLNLINQFGIKKHFDMEEDEMILAKMINFGVRNCTSDKIVVLESDRVLTKGYFSFIIPQIKPKISISCKTIKKIKEKVCDDKIKNNDFPFFEEHRSESNMLGQRNIWSGNTAFWKQDFFEADLMDEGYVGYGWADNDMTQKMQEIGVKNILVDYNELHLWHRHETYGKVNQKLLFLKNGLRYCKKWNIKCPEWFTKELEEYQSIL